MHRIIISCQLGGAILLFALTGCNRGADNTVNGTTGPVTSGTSATKSAAPVKMEGKAQTGTSVKMTVSQALGVNILKSINAAPGMSGHKISVGTTKDTVILNGTVKSAAQKKSAETIARQKAKTAKIINKIEVSTK